MGRRTCGDLRRQVLYPLQPEREHEGGVGHEQHQQCEQRDSQPHAFPEGQQPLQVPFVGGWGEVGEGFKKRPSWGLS